MKARNFLSLMLLFAILITTFVLQTVSVSAVTTTVLDENFNSFNTGAFSATNWTNTNTNSNTGTITIENSPSTSDKSLAITRTVSTTSTVLQTVRTGFTATPTTGQVVVVSAKIKFTSTTSGGGNLTINSASGSNFVRINFANVGSTTAQKGICYYANTTVGWVTMMASFDATKFYEIKTVINLDTDKADIYIDGTKYANQFAVRALNLSDVGDIRVYTDTIAANKGVEYVNDLKVLVTNQFLPSVTNLAISGNAKVNNDVTANYDFESGTGEMDGSTYQWMSCDTIDGTYIDLLGKTAKTMTITPDLVDKYLKVNITPKDTSGYTGTTLTSTAVGPVLENSELPTATDVSFINNNVVLTGQYTYSSPVSRPEGASTYRWVSSDTENGTYSVISGATEINYTPDYTNSKKYIKFEVTPADDTALAGNPVLSVAQKIDFAIEPPVGADSQEYEWQTNLYSAVTFDSAGKLVAPSIEDVVYADNYTDGVLSARITPTILGSCGTVTESSGTLNLTRYTGISSSYEGPIADTYVNEDKVSTMTGLIGVNFTVTRAASPSNLLIRIRGKDSANAIKDFVAVGWATNGDIIQTTTVATTITNITATVVTFTFLIDTENSTYSMWANGNLILTNTASRTANLKNILYNRMYISATAGTLKIDDYTLWNAKKESYLKDLTITKVKSSSRTVPAKTVLCKYSSTGILNGVTILDVPTSLGTGEKITIPYNNYIIGAGEHIKVILLDGFSNLKPIGVEYNSAYQLTLPSYFNDNMVLQRDESVNIWGKDRPGREVTVSFAGQIKSAITDVNGDWLVQLDPMVASATGRNLEISTARNTVTFQNVLVGEVWMVTGQSNAEFYMNQYSDTTTDIANANYPLIRYMRATYTNINATTTPPMLDDYTAKIGRKWEEISPAVAATVGCTAFYYARSLHTDLGGVPVGIINNAKAGKRIKEWLPVGSIQSSDGLYAANGIVYNELIAPFLKYTFKGIIWSQGENDYNNTQYYIPFYKKMTEVYRTNFNKPTLPFYYVQLHRFNDTTSQYAPRSFENFRELQRQMMDHIGHIQMSISSDIGENDNQGNNHPIRKNIVGQRLSNLAMYYTYNHTNIVPTGPLYKSHTIDGNSIKIKFDYVGNGLVIQNSTQLEGFVIAGDDGVFYPAIATINAIDEVTVFSTQVASPTKVRYLYSKWPDPITLYNSAGIPASPFTTDIDYPNAFQ